MSETQALLQVRGLSKHFPVTEGVIFQRQVATVQAVDGLDFDLRPGETLALVGESGCGKSTTGRLLLRLLEPTGGSIHFQGQEITHLQGKAMRSLRRSIQIIFQDPFASLNPRMTVGQIIAEPIRLHGLASDRKGVEARVAELMDLVGLSPWHRVRYPHEFSGGQRQRIGIARALAVDPRLIVCDEPVSALDVSIQGQVLNLLRDLQERLGLAYLFIAHDLAVVKHMSDRVAIMYLGKIVELADKQALYDAPHHPYTQALLSSIPVAEPGRKTQRVILQGDVPSPLNPPSGCRFRTRCEHAQERCKREEPPLQDDGKGHLVACHYWKEIRPPAALKRLTEKSGSAGFQQRLALYRKAAAQRQA